MAELSGKPNRFAGVVSAMPMDCSPGQLQEHLDSFFRELRRSLPGESELVARALKKLRERPAAPAALMERYTTLPQVRFQERFEILQVLGELQREEAFEGLVTIVWQRLPPRPARVRCKDISLRTCEERIQSKAVHGIAYLRNDRAFAEAERIMLNHESVVVRVAAIDAYMWNKGDSHDAAVRLYSLLPREFHPYVERARYHRGMDPERFEMQMLSWMNRWAPKGQLPPNPKFLGSGGPHADAKR